MGTFIENYLETQVVVKSMGNFLITATGRPYSDLVLHTTKHERVLDLTTFSYKRPCPDGYNEYCVVDAEPNGIMPPLRPGPEL